MRVSNKTILALAFGVSATMLGGCASSGGSGNSLPAASFVGNDDNENAEKYIIGALDELTVFVWRNPELGAKVQVRPDGRITTPLISDMVAVGKTPGQLADEIKAVLTQYIEDPRVSVMVDKFQGTFSQQIRVVGATEKPASLPYRANMTLLDAMIEVGGLSEYAAGNRARLVRQDRATGKQVEYDLKISSLLKRGDTRANVRLEPGDVIIIPETMF
ncbi:XrtA/PEP-CTERM system exopolysaccharide export protein [Sphingosinicella rhizophila]|uniref:Polysaccharide export protein n=1 Tax=Sphingosinicella rhizophila TaxID=3050082 RepID=A0ABU3Q2X9_9SPHN|nr:XrtA/PEP-CTERM system exopolysaccharide export protein [Sphingosinicella sp. GR2756]MDT9597761.1 polysaccharide export protein [Sphingosinicella sp. GR2756]